MTAKLKLVITGLFLLLLPLSVFSHHSLAEFDQSVDTELEGTIVQVLWRNPHVLIDIAIADESGAETVWRLEGGGTGAQSRRGVEEDQIWVGQKVRVAGWLSTRRDNYLLANHMLMPDSVELLVGRVREARWSETSYGGNRFMGLSASPDERLDVTSGHAERLFRVWILATRAWYFRGADASQLTEEAIAAKSEWNEFQDNPILRCTPPGMPALMGNPYPMQFVQLDNTIELKFEEFDVVRTIHLNDDADSAQQPLSPLGYSVAQWEDGTLVVNTNRINWPYFDRSGVPQSNAVEVEERFTAVVIDNQEKLKYQLTVTDPTTLTEPFIWNNQFDGRDGEVLEQYDCVLDDLPAE